MNQIITNNKQTAKPGRLKMNKLNFYWIDAFTTEKFGGNPAVVVLSQEPLSKQLMQSYAAEFNVSETAFVWPLVNTSGEQSKCYSLKWFTPVTEIELCGHATLASTYAACDFFGLSEITFSTASGEIKVSNQEGIIQMEMPRLDVEPLDKTAKDYELIISAINQNVVAIHKSKTKYLVELESEKSVLNTQPNLAVIESLERNGVIITAKSETTNHDFVSRFFAPKMGVDEDPVTGSAHCSLAPYWSQKLNKTEMIGAQLSQRGGEIAVKLTKDIVEMKGKCAMLFKGTN